MSHARATDSRPYPHRYAVLLPLFAVFALYPSTLVAQLAECRVDKNKLVVTGQTACSIQADSQTLVLDTLIMGDASRLVVLSTPGTDANDAAGATTLWRMNVRTATIGNDVAILARGSTGHTGRDGARGRDLSNCMNGGEGHKGKPGERGTSGLNVELKMGFSALGSLTIDTSGGNGGSGGVGGRGGQGSRGVRDHVTTKCNGHAGGKGGRGGKGGDGGNGGHISLSLMMSQQDKVVPLLSRLKLLASPGEPGAGGKGGVGGPGGGRDCNFWGCTKSGDAGEGGGAGSHGGKGQGGKLRAKVDQRFTQQTSGAGWANDSVRDACGRVAELYPRFLSMMGSYLIDNHLSHYVQSQLSLATHLEGTLPGNATQGYIDIRSEMENINAVVSDRYRDVSLIASQNANLYNEIQRLEGILQQPDQTRCFAGLSSEGFATCRATCEKRESEEQTSHDIVKEHDQSRGGSDAGSTRVGSKTGHKTAKKVTSYVSVVPTCVTSCLKDVHDTEKSKACGEVHKRIVKLRDMASKTKPIPTVDVAGMMIPHSNLKTEFKELPFAVVGPDGARQICGVLVGRKCGEQRETRWNVSDQSCSR